MSNYFNYFTEIEEHFVRLRNRNLLLSPLDWSLIETWKKSGIPLAVVLRGIERSFENAQKRSGKVPKTLFYCHPAVVEAFEEYQEGRVGAASESEPAEKGSPERGRLAVHVEGLIQEVRRLSSCRDDLGEIPRRVEERLLFLRTQVEVSGVRLQEIDRELIHSGDLLTRQLEEALPPAERQDILKQVKDELKAHRKRLGKEMYQRLVESYHGRRLREHFGLSEFSILDV